MSETEPGHNGAPKRPKRPYRSKLLWAAGAALYFGAVWAIGWERVREALTDVDVWTVLGMCLVTFAALWLRVLKWRIALGPGARSMPLFFLSKAAGEWSPARMGEFSPLLIRRHRTARMAAWILVDRVLEMTCTVAIGVLGLAFVSLPNRGALIAAGTVMGAGFVAALFLLANASYWERQVARFSPEGRLHRIAAMFPTFAREIRTFGRTSVYTGALTLLSGALDVWAGMLLYEAFGYPISVQVSAASKGIHAIVSAIPVTPNATGVPYFATATLIHELSHVPTPVLAAGVAMGVLFTNLVFWGSLGVGAAGFRAHDPLDE